MNLSEIALTAGRKQKASGNATPVDIITFVTSKWGLNQTLYPVQRIILKASYGMELDDVDECVTVWDWRHENAVLMTEADYLRYLNDNGRCNIREVTPGVQRRELVLAIGRRSGKCILGDSLILTDEGIYRMGNLGDPDGPEVQPLDIGVAQEGHQQSRSKFFYNGGIRDTRTLTTRCGYQLGGTDNHRIKVLSEQGVVDWRYLADLQVGDIVCIHRNTDLWASKYVDCTPFHNAQGYKDLAFPIRLDEDWGRLLGYLVGDGLWNYENRVEITVEHPETWETLKDLYTKLFGSFSVAMDKRTENTGALKFYSVGMRRFLHDLGFRLGTDRDAKMVPWSIFQSPRPVVQAFLRGLFETDGGVESRGKIVSFCTASTRLAREVQTLLLNLGITSRIKPKTVKNKVYWILTVRGLRSRTAFTELVGFDSDKKMGPLRASLHEATREGGNAESIPHQGVWIRRLLESVSVATPGQGWNRSTLRGVLGNTIKPSCHEDLTYPRLFQVLPVAEQLGADLDVIQHFKALQETDYFFDPVVNIEEGRNPVFDLNVPEGESFVANGMTNHNTYICACIAAYEIYKLLLKECPQDFYGLSKTNTINVVSIATNKDQAKLLYDEASGHFSNCAFFHEFTANNTQSFVKFQTPRDIKQYGRYTDDPSARATLQMKFLSCVASGIRGSGSMVVILDELAHFNDTGESDAKKIYTSVKPSLAAFSPKDPNNRLKELGPVEGRMISISSPLGRQGHFYNLFMQGMKGGRAAKNMLCIQAPTWEVNPSVEADFLEEMYAQDSVAFFTEFGAQFLDATSGWLNVHADLFACVDKTAKPITKGVPKRPYFLGVDIALVGDYSAVSVGHIDGDGHIVVDAMERIRAGEGQFKGLERLDFDAVADWIYNLSRRFYIVHGVFDQWAGIPFEQALQKRGLTTIIKQMFTKPLTSQVFQNFKDMMWDGRLVLYDYPRQEVDGETVKHCDYIEELLSLQATYHSQYVTTVEAPNTKDAHDDYSDALVRMVWLASQHLGKRKYVAGAAKAVPQQGTGGATPQQLLHAQRKARVQARLGGTSPDRQKSRIQRGAVRGRH